MRERLVGSSCFAASVLIGSDVVDPESHNINGLPSVSSSVKMIGRFQRLLSLDHEHICHYVGLLRCSSVANSIILIAEHYETSLADMLNEQRPFDVSAVAEQLVSAVSYLHNETLRIGFLKSSSVRTFVNGKDLSIRLSQYGLRHVTNDSQLLVEPLVHDFYMSPELFLSDEWETTYSSDIWALGIVLLEISLGTTLGKVWSHGQYLAVLEEVLLNGSDSSSAFDGLLQALKNTASELNEIPEQLSHVIRNCLLFIPSKRPLAADIMRLLNIQEKQNDKFESIEAIRERIANRPDNWKMTSLPLELAFFIWKLCGSSAEAILVKEGHIRVQYPIMTVPLIVVGDLHLIGNDECRRCCSPLEVLSLPSKNLLRKLNEIDDAIMNHSVQLNGIDIMLAGSDLPLMVKEKDVTYQVVRSQLVAHLLNAPDGSLLCKAIISDIPPLVRGAVWTRLLDFHRGDCLPFYELDTLLPHTSDRQLDVDIPRCHQYDELMTSPVAHWKLRCLLKAWLLSHPEYVYWQGCDSLSTPFLILHFNNLPTAHSCLSAFVKKYLFNFFLKDNSAVIQEHLAVFFHLLAYTDAKFYSALVDMDFYPELFAIPWFLTCFAHVLPIHKLIYVWDVILLHDSSFPLFVGLALLRQLRPQIMDSNFNDVILLFSDLPDLPMDRVLEDSMNFYRRVPPSCARRCHASEFKPETIDELRNLPCSLRPVPHSELRLWHCPRMSSEEFVYRVKKEQIAVLDIRSSNEYCRGHVVRSLSCQPNASAFLSVREVLRAAQRNQHPICIVGGKDIEATKKFVSLLVLKEQVDGICVLDVGFDRIRDRVEIIDITQ